MTDRAGRALDLVIGLVTAGVVWLYWHGRRRDPAPTTATVPAGVILGEDVTDREDTRENLTTP